MKNQIEPRVGSQMSRTDLQRESLLATPKEKELLFRFVANAASGSRQSGDSHGAQISVTKGIVEGKQDDKNVLPKRR